MGDYRGKLRFDWLWRFWSPEKNSDIQEDHSRLGGVIDHGLEIGEENLLAFNSPFLQIFKNVSRIARLL